jgi:6-phosphogluconolactonase
VYQALAARDDVPWQQVHVYFGDERAVPPDDPESNFGMARETLLARVPVPETQIHRMHAEASDVEAAARTYEELLPARFDLVLLGIGEDGHTASLFPGSSAVTEQTRRVLFVTGPKPPPRRLTITPPVIAAARATLVLAAGAAKAEAVARALEGADDVIACPAQLARAGYWMLDRAAAAELHGGTS